MKQERENMLLVLELRFFCGADSGEAEGSRAEHGGLCGTTDLPSDHAGDAKM